VSFSEYVRRLIARDIEQFGPQRSLNSVFDLGRSADSDIAIEKDAMIARAFEEGAQIFGISTRLL